MKRLSEIAVGARAVVRRLECERDMRTRLLAMGLVPGTEVKVRNRAPMGDPTSYEVKCYNLSLRKEEASCVLVEAVPVSTLAAAPEGELRVVEIAGGRGMRRALSEAGICEEIELRKVRDGATGPVTVEVSGKSHSIGRGMAQRVLVVAARGEDEPCPNSEPGNDG